MAAEQKRKIRWAISLFLVMLYFSGSTAQAQYGGGSGTAENPYMIYTAEQMNAVGAEPNEWDKHFKLMADIDLSAYSGTQFNIIGIRHGDAFTGVFDGDGHTISNFSYTSTDKNYIGLFGCVDGETAQIKDLGLIDANVDAGTGSGVGSLVDYLDEGTVTGCYAQGGSVSGRYNVGGLVGHNWYGTITNCYSTGSVLGDVSVGGLVGWDWSGTITNCYSTSSVSGSGHNVGGLVGYNRKGDISNSFWDIETSGQSTSSGGTGKTTAEMQMASNFVGWGCDPVWTIDEGADYPRLWWENMPGEPITTGFYGGGCEGTEADPYLIYTAEQMNAIGANANDWDKHFKLMADIDLSGFTGTDFNIIGNRVSPFTGVFDGNGHTISNFSYTSTDANNIGLFRCVGKWGEDAQIKNLGLIEANVDAGTGDHVGSLVGEMDGGTINNCYAEGGSVSGSCGWWGRVGGLVGENRWGTITNCYSTGSVSGWGNDIHFVGGLVGFNSDTISNCYSTGSVSGIEDVGGLVGGNSGTITNCYSVGNVSGTTNVGGLVGKNGGPISNCYSVGSVIGTIDVGGLVGSGSATASFWDIETSGQTTSAGGTGKTTAQMQTESTFTDAGWDFVGESVNGTEDIWVMDVYPVHYMMFQIQGQGTREAPYIISEANKFIVLSNVLSSAHYRLIEDIDLAGIQWSDAVFPYFSGTFNGSSFAIRNLTIIGEDNLGLFGIVESDAWIKNLAIVDANVTGTGDNIGILAGVNDGHVSNCSSTGTVHGHRFSLGGLVGGSNGHIEKCFSICSVSGDDGFGVGGLVGANRNSGIIRECYSSGWISGRCQTVGGFVGSNNKGGRVLNCYSTCTITAMGGNQGGFVGVPKGSMINCYSIGVTSGGGLVGSGRDTDVTNCFWDIETSGQTESRGGTGLTTVEMQTASTFLEAGWDFIGETENGTEDIWWILEGQDYPRLWWELVEE